MEKLFNFGQKFPLVVLILVAVGCVFSALNVGNLWIDSSTESMMMARDPDLDYYRETLQKFGSDTMMMVYVRDENLFTARKLAVLEKLVRDLSNGETVPGVQRVESLYSVNNIKGYPGYLDNNPLMDYPPETNAEANKVRDNALNNPIFLGNLISEDGKKTVVNLYLQPTDPKDREAGQNTARGVAEVIGRYSDQFDRIFEIGGPYIRETLTTLIMKDMTTLLPLALCVLMVMLIITMGSFNGAILPVITSALSIFFTFGFMGAFDLPFNLLTFIVPVLVIVIGSTEDVHILSEYMEGLHHEGSRKLAIRFMARTIGTAIFLTSLTTFLGFLSIALNRVILLIQFGLIAGFALLINPLTTCLVSPVYLSFFGARKKADQVAKEGILTRALHRIADRLLVLIKKYKIATFIILVGGAVVLGTFAYRIKVDNDTIGYFRKDSELIRRMLTMHDELSGAQTFFIRINRETARDPEIETAASELEADTAGSPGEAAESEITIDEGTGEELITIDEGAGEDEITIFEGTGEDEITIDEGAGEDEITIDEGADEEEITGDEGAGQDMLIIEEAEGDQIPVEVTTFIQDAGEEGKIFQHPRYMSLIEKIQNRIDSAYDFDKTISIASYIRMMHREMNVGIEGNFDQTPDPQDPSSIGLIPQYAQLLHHDDISSYITTDWSETNILVRHNINSSEEMGKVLTRLNREITAMLYEVDPYLKFKITGENILVNRAADSIATSQVSGLGLLLITILIIMSILFTNIKAGLLSLVPNLFPVAVFFGIMGVFQIPLNVGTCMVAAIAIGISVDDTIHFMTRYNKEMRLLQDKERAIATVLHAEFRPILSTSIALMLGFSILAWSNLIPILYFGILSAVVMACALIADLLITPIMLTTVQLTNLSDMAGLRLAKELEASPLFRGMSMWHIKKFALMGRVVERKAGEYIIKKGDTDQQMYILLSGSVQVERKDPATRQALYVARLGVGEVFGEISLLRKAPRSANIVAVEPVTYLEIDWQGLKRIQKSSRSISLKLYLNIANILGERLVGMTNKMVEEKR